MLFSMWLRPVLFHFSILFLDSLMRAFYLILVLVLGAFTFAGLFYIRMEMSRPDHVSPREQAEQDALSELPFKRVPRTIVVPADQNVTIEIHSKEQSSVPLSATPASAVPEHTPPAPVLVSTSVPVVHPKEAEPQDFSYTLVDKIYKEPTYIKTNQLDFYNRPIVTTIPGSLRLRFTGDTTHTTYPQIEVDPSLGDSFVLGNSYTRQQILLAKKR